MAFSADYIEITLRYLFLGQECQTARCYSWDGVAVASASAVALGEAWWNHYKAAWRDLAIDIPEQARFLSVVVREVGGSLSFGEFPIPEAEQDGLRDATAGGYTDSFSAVGCRLAVGSLVTRPGQFRIPFLQAGDMSNNEVAPAFLELASELAELYSSPSILGAPVATGTIFPAVVRFGVDNNTVVAGQDVIGFVLNPFVTSQVSRRHGNGS